MISVFDYMTAAQIADVQAFTYTLDVSSAIQAAITALPARGGLVDIPVGGYRVENTINIGNGTSLAASSKNGIRLVGEAFGFGINSIINAMPVVFKLFGSAHSGSIIQINGPTTGCELSNLGFEFNSDVGATARAIVDLGASYSHFSKLGIIGPVDFGILETTNGLSGGQYNSWEDIFVHLGATSSASAQAVVITANNAAGSTDRFFDSWNNVNVIMTNSSQVGIQLQYCDSIKLTNLMFNPCGGIGLFFNYLVYPNFPAACTIWGVDVFNNTVSQTSGAPTDPTQVNRIYNFSQANGASIPTLPNLQIIN